MFYSYTTVWIVITPGKRYLLSCLSCARELFCAAEKNVGHCIYERPKTIPALYTSSPDAAHHLMNPVLWVLWRPRLIIIFWPLFRGLKIIIPSPCSLISIPIPLNSSFVVSEARQHSISCSKGLRVCILLSLTMWGSFPLHAANEMPLRSGLILLW